MMKKLCSLAFALLFSACVSSAALAAAPITAEEKLLAVENVVYGERQTGSILDRIDRIEGEFNGSNRKASVLSRVSALYDYTFDNSVGPSLVTKMNVLEWAVLQKVSNESMLDRITEMEIGFSGKAGTGSIHERIVSLSQIAFSNNEVPLEQTYIPANTLVKVALLSPINSKNAKEGDKVYYQALEDVVLDGMLVLTKGAVGEGVVAKVKKSAAFGKNAAVDIDFRSISAIDGSLVKMSLGQEAMDEMSSKGITVGASLSGKPVLKSIGAIVGAFVHGEDVDTAEGAEMYLQTADESSVYAVPTIRE